MGICVLKVAEDAGKRTLEQVAAPLLNKLASSLGAVLQVCHHISEELKMAGIVGHVRMRSIRIDIA